MVKQLPPPCDSFVLSVALPPGIAGREPPADARHGVASAAHAPLRNWTVVWHPGAEVRSLAAAEALYWPSPIHDRAWIKSSALASLLRAVSLFGCPCPCCTDDAPNTLPQDAQLQQAAALAGGSNAAADDPALATAVGGRLLHVVPDGRAAGTAAPRDQPSITAECLMVQ